MIETEGFVGIRWAILLRAKLEGAQARDGEHGRFDCVGHVDRFPILCSGAANRIGAVLAVQSDDVLRCTSHAHGLRFARPLAGAYRQGLFTIHKCRSFDSVDRLRKLFCTERHID